MIPVVSTCNTRFPEFKRLALELVMEFETFDDQRISSCPFSTTRLPSSDIVRTLARIILERFLFVSYPYDSE